MKKIPAKHNEIRIQLPDDFKDIELLLLGIEQVLELFGLDDENRDDIIIPVVDQSFVSELEVEILKARYSGSD